MYINWSSFTVTYFVFLRRSRLEAVTTDKSSPRDEPTISCGGEYVLDHIYWHDTQWLGHPAVHTTVHTTTTTIHFLTGTHTQTFFTKKKQSYYVNKNYDGNIEFWMYVIVLMNYEIRNLIMFHS